MVGEKLGSFRIEGTLGVGAMGVVYRATHEPTGKPAAVKVVNKEIAQRGRTYERFQREAEILKQFRHPNIVRFLALGRYQGTSYIAMEFISGQTVEQWLTDRGAISWPEVVDLGAQLCDALHYAHQHGVVHRDLKPSNLMLTEAGRLKLTDFGIAKDLDKTALTATGRTLGTAAYMAPEQIRGTPEVSHKTDLYALGVVLYQMLTGQPPFEGSSAVVLMHAHLNEPVPRPSSKLAEVPKALDELVVKLMAKDPSDRPWDAAAVGDSLAKLHEKASRGETVPMVWPTEGADGLAPAAPKKKKKSGRSKTTSTRVSGDGSPHRRYETGGLVLALAAIVGFVAYMFWPPSAQYRFKQAERLMASEDRHDWEKAVKEYLDPLDAKFPRNPYKATTQVWRDKLLLARAEGRSRTLQSPVNTRLNQPADEAEEKFVVHYTEVLAAEKAKDELRAVEVWKSLANQYRPQDAKERGWRLLAAKRAEDLTRSIAKRRELVLQQLALAESAEAAGRPRQAVGIRAEALERYGGYTDLQDLLGTVLAPGATPEPVHDPAEKPAPPAPEVE